MKKTLLLAAAALALATASPALAADPTTSGTATISNGVATLVSNTSVPNTPNDDYGALGFPVAAGTTLAQITQLSADYNVTDDDCGGGSPRFALNFGTNQNVFVYLGPAPTFTGCTPNTWASTGNLAGTADACRVDTSQIAGGTQCSTWAAAVALLGSRAINSISFVVDGGWKLADGEQTVQVENVRINNDTYLTEPTTTPPAGKNPAQICKAQKAALGTAAFNELWGINARSNGIGKCVSATAKARNASAVNARIMNVSKACKAKGLRGAKLGQCVAARDNLAATKTEAQEHRSSKGKAKGRK